MPPAIPQSTRATLIFAVAFLVGAPFGFSPSNVAAQDPTQSFLGAASCASTACHSGPKLASSTPSALRSSEYPLWLEKDPHARSWRTLCSEESVSILKKLGILRDGKIAKPAEYQNCLACHATANKISADGIRPVLTEGVGCESCHGNASGWFDKHYRNDWQPHIESSFGKIPLEPMVQRARNCATCHVGAKDRDMNHDIIAAGHPALYFDMASYHERYPKHWREPGEGTADYRSQLWMAGQIASAEAELELTAARATRSHSVSVWPEFSLYRCTDCHLDLQGIPRIASKVNRNLETLGRPKVRRWNLAGLDSLATILSNNDRDKLAQQRDHLIGELAKARPDEQATTEAVKRLQQSIATLNRTIESKVQGEWNAKKQLALGRDRMGEEQVYEDWEFASRGYISIWASRASLKSKSVQSSMQTLRRGLLFSKQSQSPNFPRSKTNPPTREEWNQAVHQLVSELSKDPS